MDLFAYKAGQQLKKEAPLADRMRPETLDEFVGQADVVGVGGVLRGLLERDEVPSMILWGPPGTGKTTLARIVARMTRSRFVALSATSSGVADLRETVKEAEERLRLHGTKSIVFVDEIHRWNKSQQDSFLPYVEDGTVTLIGATTENPSFEVNSALLSRSRVYVLKKLEAAEIAVVLGRAIRDPKRGLGSLGVEADDDALLAVAEAADGDARTALNALELAAKAVASRVDGAGARVVHLRREDVAKMLKRSHLLYDKSGEGHFNAISALHKSMRGSDADAALYWLGRMLEAGEEPLYVARRLVRFASEDIGLADPQALVQAVAAFQATHQLGMPECDVCLAQAVVYLARAPKSNALYAGYGEVKRDISESPNDPVPLHIRNAPTRLMKDVGYGKGYVYNPDAEGPKVLSGVEGPKVLSGVEGPVDQEYLPDRLKGRKYLAD